jgi:hypothetical protein
MWRAIIFLWLIFVPGLIECKSLHLTKSHNGQVSVDLLDIEINVRETGGRGTSLQSPVEYEIINPSPVVMNFRALREGRDSIPAIGSPNGGSVDHSGWISIPAAKNGEPGLVKILGFVRKGEDIIFQASKIRGRNISTEIIGIKKD